MTENEEGKKRRRKAPAPRATETQEPAPGTEAGFAVVGVGASAGGLSAFEAFFSGMPADTDPGMAFVLVQHLAPDHKSILSDLVKRYTRMKVFEVEDGVVVKPNCAYIIPPNRDMALQSGTLKLLAQSAPRGLRLPIDFFFRSLAEDQHERAICVVLSGTGSDGTLGVRAVKAEGGMVMAQDPDTTEYDGMPRSAVASGLVDYVLPPAEMPAQLISYVSHAFRKSADISLTEADKAEDLLKRIFVVLKAQTGHDLSGYKQNTLVRRVARRMAVHQIEQMHGYVRYLEKTPAEVDALFHDILIGVTGFFRDPESFAAFQEQVVPRLFAGKSADTAIRVWVPGCSTGEEAYSIAIMLQEHMKMLQEHPKLQVFATDIDRHAIEQARAGVYQGSISADISPERLAQFFVQLPDGNGYRVQKSLRDLLVFSEQDVVRDPPYSNLDLISCRNLLIYMGPQLQKRLVPLFHYALNTGGFLFLGTSETVGEHADIFATLDRKAKLYQSRQAYLGTQPVAYGQYVSPMATGGVAQRTTGRAPGDKRLALRELTEVALLRQYAPVAALVDEQGNILYLHGRTGLYLEPAPGQADMHILKMAREGLRRELAGALRHAVTHQEPVCRPGLRVKTNGSFTTINLTVRPASTDSHAAVEPGLFLVVFEETPEADREHPGETTATDLAGSPDSITTDAIARIAALQDELRGKDEYLQTANEELETSNEELKSSNEELQSVNEELQSTIEELETSKEELQSVNEELATVNAELQDRINELMRSNNDMNNLLTGTGIGTVFVDHQLRILRFTPTVTEVINLISTDVGRPVDHIVSRMVGYDHLAADVQEVLRSLTPREVEVQTQAGLSYMLLIHPYRTQENVIEGAVLTFIDITELKQIQAALNESNLQMQDLAARLHVAREDERAAVAWELHDEISQALAVVRATLVDWRGVLPTDVLTGMKPTLEETIPILDSTIARLRKLYADLVPVMLEDLDLASAVQWQVEEYDQRSELHCEVGTIDALELPETRTSLALFRVLQEALKNAARHPGVTNVAVDLVREGDSAILRVTDNGRGTINEDVMKPGEPALVSIRARAHSLGGTVRFRQTAEGGSVLEVTTPLREEGTEHSPGPNHA